MTYTTTGAFGVPGSIFKGIYEEVQKMPGTHVDSGF
jgi:hypothetical protein